MYVVCVLDDGDRVWMVCVVSVVVFVCGDFVCVCTRLIYCICWCILHSLLLLTAVVTAVSSVWAVGIHVGGW